MWLKERGHVQDKKDIQSPCPKGLTLLREKNYQQPLEKTPLRGGVAIPLLNIRGYLRKVSLCPINNNFIIINNNLHVPERYLQTSASLFISRVALLSFTKYLPFPELEQGILNPIEHINMFLIIYSCPGGDI